MNQFMLLFFEESVEKERQILVNYKDSLDVAK